MKKAKYVFLYIMLISILVACGQTSTYTKEENYTQESEESRYHDEEFLKDAGQAFNERQIEIKKSEGKLFNEIEEVDFIKELNIEELSKVEKYLDLKFEDNELKEAAIRYINSLTGLINKINLDALYGVNEDYMKSYVGRGSSLEYFSKYDIYIDQIDEEFKNNISQIATISKNESFIDSKVNELTTYLNSLEFEKVENDGGSWNSYTAIIENNFDANFSQISINFNLIDSDGVIVDNIFEYIPYFNVGDKYKLEFMTDSDFEKIDIKIDQYIIVEEN